MLSFLIRQRNKLLPFAGLILLLLVSCSTTSTELIQSERSFFEDDDLDPADSDVNGTQASPTNEMESTAAVDDKVEASVVSTPVTIEVTDSGIEYQGIEVGFTEDGHPYRGNPDANVIIQEFSDYQCPFCARFTEQTLPTIVEKQIASGEVIQIFYDFPLLNLHPEAMAAANAARCAGEQGADSYWAMHDYLFDTVETWSSLKAEETFVAYAEELELDLDQYQECLSEERYEAEVNADLESGRALGISGTPSFVINGQLLVGAVPLAQFESAIATVKAGGQIAGNEPDPSQEQPRSAPTPAILLSEYAATMGDPDAPVKIVEFTDYQCPYCSRHSLETLPIIISELVETGRAFYAQKDLPLDQLHPNARIAAASARCAADQGAYWELHDTLFEKQSEWAGAGAEITGIFASYALEHGLDEGLFAECLESGRHDAAVEANAQEASSLGVTGTPFFFVDGYPLNGARPYEHFELAVQYAEEGRLAEAYEPQPEEAPQRNEPADVPIGDAFILGDPGAPITIVEYTDFQCPFCSRHFNQTYPRIVEDYIDQGIVHYVFKDFPLTSIHPQAIEAAEAARCAGDQGDFLGMHHTLFSRQSDWSGRNPTEIFIGYAQDLDLDTDVFQDCLESGKFESAVNADLQEGIQLGVTGTPAFFINGYAISGAQPFELFQQAIESLLTEDVG